MKLKLGKSYRLYCKTPNMRRYLPLDLSTGCTVTRLIFAPIYTCSNDNMMQRMDETLSELKADHPEFLFEFRAIN